MHTKALKRVALLMSALLWLLTATWTMLLGLSRLSAPGGGGPQTPTFSDTSRGDDLRQPLPRLRSARFRAIGDVMVHETQLNHARREDGSYDFHSAFGMIAWELADADYTIANLETTVGKQEGRAYSGYPMFNSPESLLDTLEDAGIDFLTLANNHILDRGLDGMKMTVENVDRHGFDHGGANRTPEEKAKPVVAEVNGIRVGFLCYTEMTNGMENGNNGAAKQYGVNYLNDADLEGDVRRLKAAGAEVVVAIPHWGIEYRRQPEERTVNLARRMIAAGVDVILGSHPHMAQPVEFLEAQTESGETRRGLVVYSMGNFISNQSKQYTDWGLLVEFTLKERPEGGFDVDDVAVMPTFCWRQSEDIQTMPALAWYDAPAPGMDDATWQRLRQACDDARALIDESIPLISA